MTTYDRTRPFVPTVENPGPVSFSADGKTWTLTRDEFIRYRDGGTLQMFVTNMRSAGDTLEPATKDVEGTPWSPWRAGTSTS